MTKVYDLLHDRETKKKTAPAEACNQVALECQAGARLWDAATKGPVQREELSNVSKIGDSTRHEKGAQQDR